MNASTHRTRKPIKYPVQPVKNPKGVLTNKEAAQYLGISLSHLVFLVKTKKIAPTVLSYYGKKLFFNVSTLKKWQKQKPVYNWKG